MYGLNVAHIYGQLFSTAKYATYRPHGLVRCEISPWPYGESGIFWKQTDVYTLRRPQTGQRPYIMKRHLRQ